MSASHEPLHLVKTPQEVWTPCLTDKTLTERTSLRAQLSGFKLCTLMEDLAESSFFKVLYCPYGECRVGQQPCIAHDNPKVERIGDGILEISKKPITGEKTTGGAVYHATAKNGVFDFVVKVAHYRQNTTAEKLSGVTVRELLVGLEVNKMIQALETPHFMHTYGYRCQKTRKNILPAVPLQIVTQIQPFSNQTRRIHWSSCLQI